WPAYWNGERYAVFQSSNGAQPAGATANTGPASGVVQDELCTDCCRDHHDPVTVESDDPSSCSTYDNCEEDIVRYDPFRTDGHQHYMLQGDTLVPAGSGDNYLEACRMIRVDGFWRVAADLGIEHFGLIATLNSGRLAEPTSAAVDGYEEFVIDYLGAKYGEGGTEQPAETVFDGKGLNDPATIAIGRPTPIDTRFLHARGLYVDYLERKARKKLEVE